MAATVRIVVTVSFLAAVFSFAASASIFDFLSWDSHNNEKQRNDDDLVQRTCACNGPSCMCCVDFNMTYVDLGGPGCVTLHYLSDTEGVDVNVSYGDALLHSGRVRPPDPQPACLRLLSSFAAMCATFNDFQNVETGGLRGCVRLEPRILGDATGHFDVGCFRMDGTGMKMEQGNSTTTTSSSFVDGVTESVASGNESSAINEEEIMAVVNETAEKGLAFFGNLLGFAFGTKEDDKSQSGGGNGDQ